MRTSGNQSNMSLFFNLKEKKTLNSKQFLQFYDFSYEENITYCELMNNA